MQKKAPKVTVREIAKQTGYAHCTVARALSDAGNVALETRSRILAAARELGYLGRSRKNIAVIMHEFGTELRWPARSPPNLTSIIFSMK